MASGHHRGAPLVGAQTHGAQGADAVSWYPASRVLPRDPDDRGAVEGWPPAPAAGGSRGSRDRRCDPVPPLRAGVWQLVYWPCFDRRTRGRHCRGRRARRVRARALRGGRCAVRGGGGRQLRPGLLLEASGGPAGAPRAGAARHPPRRLRAGADGSHRPLPGAPPRAAARRRRRGRGPGGPDLRDGARLVAEGRLAFHPDHSHRKPYHAQRAAAAPYIEAFERSRLPRLLAHFERLLAAGADEGPEGAEPGWPGRRLSYVDLQLFVALRAARASFPGAGGLPARLAAFERQIAGRRRIADYLDSPRCRPFAGDSMM
ncbi:unnamed protein product [Prorocentrum cordatum]|uniref:Glutathione S-transferase C-terminal domain-containing protein n=1 Tax=Prorocentrum cordatum TaxID=2364126 RepID=A0ABN9UXR5_9DINO|nr:unnamed protein product [Polarella glacialis]